MGKMAFTTTHIVRFHHCDPAGIVFYPRYYDMLNATIEEWFETRLGWPFAAIHGPMSMGVPTVSQEARYFRPSRLAERLDFVLAELQRRSQGGLVLPQVGDAELDAAGDFAVVNVEARNDSWSKHQRAPFVASSHASMTASPHGPESSGWNWQASTLPRSIAATNGPPWSAIAGVHPSGAFVIR